MRIALLAIALLALVLAGCMDPLQDYNKCVAIEKARCELHDSCYTSFDYETCVSYYKEFCRTRKMNGPGSDMLTDEMVQACVDAILEVPCEMLNNGLDETELLPECDFLQKKPEDTDPDAGAGDGGGDADSDTDGDTDTDTDSGSLSGESH